jgi:acetyl-CoA decarbonylase/synthase complex subunit delta
MPVPSLAEKWSTRINEVTIGATAAEGGTRSGTVTVGGAGSPPFLRLDGDIGRRPAIAVEVWDAAAEEMWPDALKEPYGDALSDPAKAAAKAVEFGAELISLKLMGTHPDYGDRSPDQAADAVKAVLGAVGVPLVIWPCGVPEKDNDIVPACTQAAKGENCLVGLAKEKNYRTVAASCLADGHKLICESPLDINIAKQTNVLASDAGFPLTDIVMHPTTGSLGYGLEYVYSILERCRLAGLSGDKLLQQPIILDCAHEAWRSKEGKSSEDDLPGFGTAAERGTIWEALTATNLLQAGADIVVLRHPDAVAAVRQAIDRFCAE